MQQATFFATTCPKNGFIFIFQIMIIKCIPVTSRDNYNIDRLDQRIQIVQGVLNFTNIITGSVYTAN